MIPERSKVLLEKFQTILPASAGEIETFEGETEVTLPPEYCEFLRFTNGGEGFIGPNSYAMLWKIGELLQFNREYQVHEYAPGLLLFGSSGGGEAFAFDLRVEGKKSIVSVPFIGMNLSDALPLAQTFDEFLEYLARQ